MPELEEKSVSSIDISPDDTKSSIRTKVWDYLDEFDISLDPKLLKRRISNFKGSVEAGEKISTLEIFKNAQVVRIDPDKTLHEIRLKTLEAGKTLLVPTPQLRNHVVSEIILPENCSEELFRKCAARQGVEHHSRGMDIDEKIRVDVYIVGSVAVSTKGLRIGKGGGLSDLEYAMMASIGGVDPSVPVITMVHDCQVLDLPEAMFGKTDLPVDIIVTPTRVIECTEKPPKPDKIIWDLLEKDKLDHIPVLKRIRFRQWKAGLDVKLSDEDKNPEELVEVILEEGGSTRGRSRGNANWRRNFRRREDENGDAGDGETKRDRGDDRRGRGLSNRGRYRSYRNRRFSGRYGDAQRDDRRDATTRNASGERPGNRAYDKRSRQPRRRPTFETIEGSIYVGSLPRSLRVSEFKTEVRERKVNPLRVLWRGSSGFAFLNFKSQQDAEDALVALEGLHISDKAIKFEMAKSPTGQRRSGSSRNATGEGHADSVN